PSAAGTLMHSTQLLPIDTPPDRLTGGLNGALSYGKTAQGLVLLRETILGPERFDAAFRTYIRRWSFKSPQPSDFFRSMEDAAGMDLAWFWREWFLETDVLDQAVGSVVQPEASWHRDTGEWTWTPGKVVIENRGDMVMPIVFTVTFEGGEQRTV